MSLYAPSLSSLLWRRPLTPQVWQRQGSVFSLWAWQRGGLIAASSRGPQCALRLARSASGCVCGGVGKGAAEDSNHSEHPERLPSGRVVKAAGGKQKKDSGESGVSDARLSSASAPLDDMCKQTKRGARRREEATVSAPCPTTRRQPGRAEKTDKLGLFLFFPPLFLFT